uniref:AlNc14C246G9570 protein n=1 Tax=Albugo laibachii Nc14 TaxID=890382 RepID=F0WT85_9STRA|nr:AlNc14C246G9570 [Albugo laibachii Nc14]|eukprot:CCA24573.1 AlNc14C246G9570 [Albugo laibachii Nc14]
METTRTQRSVGTMATPSMMKRVDGGYVVRYPSLDRNQQQHRGARSTPPTPIDTRRMAPATIRARVAASQQRPASIQVDRATPPTPTVPRRTASATRPARPMAPPQIQGRIQLDRASPPTPTLARIPASATPVVRLVITEPPQTSSSDLSRLKEENEVLSASLADKSEDLRNALERERRFNHQVEDLKEKLQTSLKKNEECQQQLDDALATHLEDQRTIKLATVGQQQLKADVAGSRKMLEGLKIFMVEQGKQLEALQLARDHSKRPTHSTKTIGADTTRIQSHGVHAIEDFYREHWKQDQLKVKIAMEQNEEMKEEVAKSREMLIDFKSFMENKVNKMDKI